MAVQGAKQLNARLEAIKKAPPVALNRLALVVVREAKLRVARKTGQTGRTIHVARRTPTVVTITAGGAALFLEFGTRPHDIYPVRRKALRWAAQPQGRRLSGRPRVAAQRGGLGGVLFAKRVHHPGTRPQPFMRPAVDVAVRQAGFKDAVIKAWNDAA